jgi:hypothetical protein
MQSGFSSVAYEAFDEFKYTMIVTYFRSSSISICNVVILRMWFLWENGGKSKYVTMAANCDYVFQRKLMNFTGNGQSPLSTN